MGGVQWRLIHRFLGPCMFSHIDLKKLGDSTLFGYAKDVPFFQGKKKIAFKPGLNVLWGKNGSGKSTILKILGESMCATQGGTSAITENAIHTGIDMLSGLRIGRTGTRGDQKDRFGLTVAHDGQGVLFCDPRQTVGLIGGGFDDDFFQEGLTETMAGRRQSHGQAAMRRSTLPLSILQGMAPFPTAIRRTISAKHVNEQWKRALELIEKRLVASIPLGQPTMLLDEPEANFSLDWQARLWTLLANPEMAKKYQIIVASHSAFSLGIAHANYIDLVPDIRLQAEAMLRERFGGKA